MRSNERFDLKDLDWSVFTGIYKKKDDEWFTDYDIPRAGISVSLGDMAYCKYPEHEDTNLLYHQPELFGYSDYSGSPVERSNHNVFMRQFGDVRGVVETYGGYGSVGLAIHYSLLCEDLPCTKPTLVDTVCFQHDKLNCLECGRCENCDACNEQEQRWDMREMLNSVSDYPAVDDGDMSELENEIEEESWESDYREDFRKALGKRFVEFFGELLHLDPEYDYEDAADEWEETLTDKQLRHLLYTVGDRISEYWIHEDPVHAYIDVKRIAKAVTRSDIEAAREEAA